MTHTYTEIDTINKLDGFVHTYSRHGYAIAEDNTGLAFGTVYGRGEDPLIVMLGDVIPGTDCGYSGYSDTDIELRAMATKHYQWKRQNGSWVLAAAPSPYAERIADEKIIRRVPENAPIEGLITALWWIEDLERSPESNAGWTIDRIIEHCTENKAA